MNAHHVPTGMMPTAIFVVGSLVAMEVAAIAWGLAPSPLWLGDLGVGMAFVALAAFAWAKRRRVAILATLFAMTWWTGSVFPFAVFWHRGVLLNLLIVFAIGSRRVGLPWRIAIGVGYALSMTPFLWNSRVIATCAGVAIITGAGMALRRPAARVRADLRCSAHCAIVFAVAVIGGVVARGSVPQSEAVIPAQGAYFTGLVVIAALLARALARIAAASISDVVVDLSAGGRRGLRNALSLALGDEELMLAYWDVDSRTYRDVRDATAVTLTTGRRHLIVETQEGAPLAIVLVNLDLDLDLDPALSDGVRQAVRFTARNEQLAHETQRTIDDIRDSRDRLILADERERRRWGSRLEESVIIPLRTLSARLAAEAADSYSPNEGAGAAVLDSISDSVRQVIVQVENSVAGLHFQGGEMSLSASVRALADRFSVHADFEMDDNALLPAERSMLYFTSAEAMTNAIKHGAADRMSFALRAEPQSITLEIGDNGLGGAAIGSSGGLRGLAERLAVAHGELTVLDRPGGGTLLRARLHRVGDSAAPPGAARERSEP